jgi:hypothetical protein
MDDAAADQRKLNRLTAQDIKDGCVVASVGFEGFRTGDGIWALIAHDVGNRCHIGFVSLIDGDLVTEEHIKRGVPIAKAKHWLNMVAGALDVRRYVSDFRIRSVGSVEDVAEMLPPAAQLVLHRLAWNADNAPTAATRRKPRKPAA